MAEYHENLSAQELAELDYQRGMKLHESIGAEFVIDEYGEGYYEYDYEQEEEARLYFEKAAAAGHEGAKKMLAQF